MYEWSCTTGCRPFPSCYNLPAMNETNNGHNTGLDAVTGAFGYTGRYIAQLLLDKGQSVRTLTGRSRIANTADDPFGGRIEVCPFNFDRPDSLAESLRGVDTLYNTYWVRFSSGAVTFDRAVENSRTLIRAAEKAGVRRLVHISITNPSADSPLPYFRGKGLVEQAIRDSGLSYAIVRPALVFGEGDILLNNIAWLLRRFPVFTVAGSGQYRAQPVYVADLAALAVAASPGQDNVISDAVGPETYTFDELVRLVARSVQRKAWIVHLPPAWIMLLSRLFGLLVGDVVLTREEIAGLAANLLTSANPPLGTTRFSVWLAENGNTLGRAYASELSRHYRGRG